MKLSLLPALAAALFALAPQVSAQFSSDPAANLEVMTSGKLLNPQVAASPDGGMYIAWFKSGSTSSGNQLYKIRLQKLDQAGVEQWPHNGVLVKEISSQIFSSTPLSLGVDSLGNAMVCFALGIGPQQRILAFKFDASGNAMWGSNGATVAQSGTTKSNPRMDVASNGDAVVIWDESEDLHMQRLDAFGTPVWPSALNVTSSANPFRVNHGIVASDNGAVIVAFTNPTWPVSDVRLQKVSASGQSLWTPGGVSVNMMHSNWIYFDEFPLISDGLGGALFAWTVDTDGNNGTFVQRVRANGAIAFPVGGIGLGHAAFRPELAFDPSTESTYAAFAIFNAYSPGPPAAFINRYDAAGNALWGSSGQTLLAPETPAPGAGPMAVANGGVVALVTNGGELHAKQFDGSGNQVGATRLVSSGTSLLYTVNMATTVLGQFVSVFSRGQTDGIFAQNILPNLVLGGVAGTAQRNGAGGNPVVLYSTSPPSLGSNWVVQVDKSAFPANTGSFLCVHGGPSSGVIIPEGEVLIDFTSPQLLLAFANDSANLDTYTVPIPAWVALVGINLSSQALVVEPVTLSLTNALDLTLGL